MDAEITHQLPKSGVEAILARFDSIDSQLLTLNTRVDSSESRLALLAEKVERRLQETRPVWEQVLAQPDRVETRLDRLGARLERVDTRIRNNP